MSNDSADASVTGNTCNNNNYGIYVNGPNSCTAGNVCNNNKTAGISSNSNNATITGNTCKDNGIGISLMGGSRNTVTGNTCIRGEGAPDDYSSGQYTILISSFSSATSDSLFVGNNIMGKNYADGGTNNTWANNKFE